MRKQVFFVLKRFELTKIFLMDWILFAFCGFYFIKGYFKGFISMVFSLVGTFAILVIAWELTAFFSTYVQGWFGDGIYGILKTGIDEIMAGKFSSMEEFRTALMQTSYGSLFGLFLMNLIGNVSFDGSLTAGQILAPSLSELVIKALSFLFIFLILTFLLKILKFLLNKTIKMLGFQSGNKILGGFVGAIKGLIVFGVVYVILVAISNFMLNETLLNFVQSGNVSQFLYDNFIIKIINLFY